jgi:fucose permease
MRDGYRIVASRHDGQTKGSEIMSTVSSSAGDRSSASSTLDSSAARVTKQAIPMMLLWTALAGSTLSQFGALVSAIGQDLALNKSQIGLTQTAFFVGHFLGCVIMGQMVARAALKRCLLLAAISMLAGICLCSVHLYPMILLGRVLTGLGFCSSILIATRVMCSSDPDKQASRMSCMHALVAAAAAGMFFIAEPVAKLAGNWSYVFALSATILTAVAVVILSLKLGEIRRTPPANVLEMSRVVRHPIILACIPAVMGYLIIEQSMTMFLPALLKDRWMVGTGLATAAGALFWGGIIMGRFGVMPLTRRFKESQIIAFAGLMMGVCCATVALTHSLSVALPCIVLAGIFGGPIIPLSFAWAARSLQYSSTAAITCCQLAACAGGLLGPMLTGTLADTIGLSPALAIAGALVAQGVFPIVMSLLAVAPRETYPAQSMVTE